MSREKIEELLFTYISQEILKGKAEDLNNTTPLLDLGLLDSFSIISLLSYIEKTFATDIPLEKITPSVDLKDISHIADMIARTQKSQDK